MKKVLGRLSRSFHKDGESLNEILPQIKDVFEQIKETLPNDTKKCLNMIVNITISDIKFSQEVYEWASVNSYLTEQIVTAMVRALGGSDIDGAISLIGELENIKTHIKPHIRTFIPLFQNSLNLTQYNQVIKLINNYEITPNTELFSLLISSAPTEFIGLKNLIVWSGQHCDVMDPIVSQSNITKMVTTKSIDGVCQNCKSQLKTVPLSPTQRKLMLNSVFEKESNPSIVRWVQTKDYDIVIDGANVAHYNNSPFDIRKVVTMIDKINKGYGYDNPNILLVFSICRKKQTRGLPEKWKNVTVYYTKAGTNDDLSWLYAALWYPNIWCITNDQMRDHVYYKFTEAVGRNVIDIWMERNIVNFEFIITQGKGGRNGKKKNHNVQMRIDTPLPYSIRPQVGQGVEGDDGENDGRIHLPISLDLWCCGEL